MFAGLTSLLVLSCGGSNCLCVRCPEFESWSGYVLFPPVTFGGLWGGVHARGGGPCSGFEQQKDCLVSSKQIW